ncbi:MAG: NUDIX domain-containing protein [Oscillospiraceae bacterium]|nr:NUDIX domain-containing protein [Oscillospiraceae bacterium]
MSVKVEVKKSLKTLDIIGDNYSGSWTDTRTACRGIVIKDGKLLLSFESLTGQWMIPGGGLEPGEDELTCCAREVAEETGLIVQPSDCVLEIDEYYESFKWVNRYFFCEVTGKAELNLTEREKEVGMEPRWLHLDEIIRIFSKHASYADTDEMRRGMYLREYTALRELL